MFKDLQVWLRQPVTLIATVAPALILILVELLGAQAVGRSPVALVVQDSGPQGLQMAQAIRDADVFRLQEVDAARAQALLKNLDVVAVVTIPAGFSQRVQAQQAATVNVTVNNLNLDFTNDIRRAVPDAITRYYAAQGDKSPVKISMDEHDLRQRDIQIFQYSVLPIVVLLLIISGLISGGNAAAREWESSTVKELLLSPAPGGAIIAGKVLAGFLTSFGLGMLVLLAADGLGWIYPQGIYWLDSNVGGRPGGPVGCQPGGGDRGGVAAHHAGDRGLDQPGVLPVLPGGRDGRAGVRASLAAEYRGFRAADLWRPCLADGPVL